MKYMNKELLNRVNYVIDKKQIRWEFGIDNARIVTKYAIGGNSISEMLFSDDCGFTGVLVPSYSVTETTFLEKLKIKHWSYTDFLVSAILFCIQHELTYGASSFYVLSKNIVYVLFDTTSVGDEIFKLLQFTELFTLYKRDCLSAINAYFQDVIKWNRNTPGEYRWTNLGISRILSLFFVDPLVQDRCIKDCSKQNALGPFILALYTLEIKNVFSDKTTTSDESLRIINSFSLFKKNLIREKFLTRKNFFYLFFEKNKDIKNFYGSYITVKLSGNIVLALTNMAITRLIFLLKKF